ncbi:MAG: M4 family metallopeptidase [Gemmatimonadota bacterium]|jgi:Zn-dependent metalloprotease
MRHAAPSIRARLLFPAILSVVAACGLPQTLSMAERAVSGPDPQELAVTAHHGPWSTLPSEITFAPNTLRNRDVLQGWVQDQLGVSLIFQHDVGPWEGADGHQRFGQVYDGIPVEGAGYTAHVREGSVASLTGTAYRDIDVSTRPTVEAEEARALVAREWPDGVLEEEPQLVVLPELGGTTAAFHLAWALRLFDPGDGRHVAVWVDAREPGVIRRAEPTVAEAFPPGIGTTSGGRTVTFGSQPTSAVDPGDQAVTALGTQQGFRLMDPERNLHTLSVEGFESPLDPALEPRTDGSTSPTSWDEYFPAAEVVDEDDVWDATPVAVDVQWGMTAAYEYFLSVHGWRGYDGNGGYLRALVVPGFGYAGFAGPNTLLFGSSSVDGFDLPLSTLDLVAHEYGHAVVKAISGLGGLGEAGALSEAISDIFMTQVKFSADQGDWLLNPGTGSYARSLSDPKSTENPDTYEGAFWAPFTSDSPWESGGSDTGPHANSTVVSHWFYLLAEGGEGKNDNDEPYSVTPIGREQAAALVFETLFDLPPTATFEAMRYATVRRARARWGRCSDEMKQVVNAWYAVGVGAPYCGCFEGSFDFTAAGYSGESGDVGFDTWIDQGSGETKSTLRYYIRGDDYAVSLTDASGNENVVFTSKNSPSFSTQGYPMQGPTRNQSTQDFMGMALSQTKIPLIREPQRPLTRKEYLAYRNAARTGRTWKRAGYTVSEYAMEEVQEMRSLFRAAAYWGFEDPDYEFFSNTVIYATEDICLSFADLGRIRMAFDPGVDRIARQMLFGFPLVIKESGEAERTEDWWKRVEGSLVIDNIREGPVPDRYFRMGPIKGR